MRSRASTWTKLILSILLLLTLALLYSGSRGRLILQDMSTGQIYGSFPIRLGEEFSIGFIHSVNKSPVIDYYRVKEDGIYVERTKYYGFGAGVQTELSEGETLTYTEDGAMVVSGFDQRLSPLCYFVGTVSDHILTLRGQEISLRELCGRSSRVEIRYMSDLSRYLGISLGSQ